MILLFVTHLTAVSQLSATSQSHDTASGIKRHYKASTDDERHRTSLTQKICGCYDTRLCLETGMRFIATTHRDEDDGRERDLTITHLHYLAETTRRLSSSTLYIHVCVHNRSRP